MLRSVQKKFLFLLIFFFAGTPAFFGEENSSREPAWGVVESVGDAFPGIAEQRLLGEPVVREIRVEGESAEEVARLRRKNLGDASPPAAEMKLRLCIFRWRDAGTATGDAAYRVKIYVARHQNRRIHDGCPVLKISEVFRVPADAADFAMPSPSAEDMAFVRRIAEKMKREKDAIRKKPFATRFSSPIAGASSEKILLAVRNAFAFWRVPDVCAEIDGDFYVWASGFPEQGVIADGEKSKLHSWGKGIAFGAIGRIENLEVVPLRNCLPPKNLQEEPLAAGTPEDEALIRSFVAAQAPYFFVREEKENPEKFKIQAEDFYPALTGKALLTYFRTAFSPDRAFGEMHIVCREEDGYFYVWRRGNAKRGFVVRKADRFFCEWAIETVILP